MFLELVDLFIFWGSSEAAMGGGGAQRPLGVAMSPRRRVRTRGQNPLVLYVLEVKLTKDTKGRVLRGRDTDGEIGDREFGEEGVNRLIIVYVKLEKHVGSQCHLPLLY